MKFEKFVNSRFFHFTEKLYQLIMLNIFGVISILMGLVIFGIIPTMVSIIACLKASSDGESYPLFKGYFKTYFKTFKKTILVSLFFLILLLISFLWIFYFYSWIKENNNIFFGIGYYLSLFIAIIIMLSAINSCFVIVYFPYLNFKKIIKYAFVLLRAITWKAIIMFVILIAFLYLAFLIAYALPFILLSLYLFIFNCLIKNDYDKIIIEGKHSLSITKDILNIPKNSNIDK